MKRLLTVLLVTVFAVSALGQDLTNLKKEIRDTVANQIEDFIKIRRHLHMNPELGNREFETAAYIAEYMKELGYTVREKVAYTGVVAVLECNPGRTVAFRADMDALPIHEMTGLKFASENEGVMHACGHDVHMTVALGTAKVISDMRDKVNGTVKFIFQPAEEGPPAGEDGGADLMIEQGALADPVPEAIFGLHAGPDVDAGKIGYTNGSAMASNDGFRIKIKGKGTHAAYPWEGIDPVVIASHVVIGLQNIRSRMTDTRIPLVVSVGMLQAGNRSNIIPEDATLVGTVRNHDQVTREKVRDLMEQVVSGICSAFNAEYDFNFNYGLPVTYNGPDISDWSANVLKNVLGENRVIEVLPSMGAEDFSYYGHHVPAFFYWLGVRNEELGYTAPLHNPHFNSDEDAIPVGIEAMVNLGFEFLNSSEQFKAYK